MKTRRSHILKHTHTLSLTVHTARSHEVLKSVLWAPPSLPRTIGKSLYLSFLACTGEVILDPLELSVMAGPDLTMRFLQVQHGAVAQNQVCCGPCQKPLFSVMILAGLDTLLTCDPHYCHGQQLAACPGSWEYPWPQTHCLLCLLVLEPWNQPVPWCQGHQLCVNVRLYRISQKRHLVSLLYLEIPCFTWICLFV